MAPPVRNLTDVLLDPTEDEPTVEQIAELFLRDSNTTFTNKTLNDISNFIYANGLHLKVTALENINIGQPVKFTSYNVGQDKIEVNLADNTLGTSIGLAKENVLSGNEFTIVCCGCLKGFDTTAYSDGEILYLDTNGTLTHTEPLVGIAQPIAFVIKSAGGTNGALRVNAAYPKQDAADVRFNSSGDSVHDVLSVMSNKNKLINGAFDLWERYIFTQIGAGQSAYFPDRWLASTSSNTTAKRATTDISPFNNKYTLIYEIDTGATFCQATQRIVAGTIKLDTQYTLSGTFRAYSGTRVQGKINRVLLRAFNSSDTNLWEEDISTINYTPLSGTSWENKTLHTFTIPDTLTIPDDIAYWSLYIIMDHTINNSIVEFAQVQLEEGSVATPFEQRPIGYERSLCERYFFKSKIFSNFQNSPISTTSRAIFAQLNFPTTMRVDPAIIPFDDQGTANKVSIYSTSGAGTTHGISYVLNGVNKNGLGITSDGVTGNTYGWKYSIEADAEL